MGECRGLVTATLGKGGAGKEIACMTTGKEKRKPTAALPRNTFSWLHLQVPKEGAKSHSCVL